MRTRHHHPAPAARSGFGGFCFPPEVIVLAVRWYLRFGLSYRDVEELLAERGIAGLRSTTSPSTGGCSGSCPDSPTPPGPADTRRRPLAGGRDLREGRWAVAVCVPGGRPGRPGHRRVHVTTTRRTVGSPVLRAGPRHDQGHPDWGCHRSGCDVPDRHGSAAPSGMAPHRAVRQQPRRGRSRPPEVTAATDTRTQAGPQRQG